MIDLSSSLPVAPHICYAVLRLDVGGLERVVLDLARDALDRGYRASVLCIERPGTLAAAAEAIGAEVVTINKTPGVQPGCVSRLTTLLRKLRPDVVHTHQIGALFYGGPATRRAGVPLVVHTEHGKNCLGNWRLRMIGRMASRYARKFFAVSSDILRELHARGIVPPLKTALVPNGIDLSRFVNPTHLSRDSLGIPPDAFVVGTVGRLAKVKRQDVLLRGFARFAARQPNAHLLVVGDGPMRAELEALASELGIAGRTTFAGSVDRPEDYLAAMNVFSLTSESEGMPLAILEAWAAVKPVIASRVGGVPELVVDNVNGLLFPCGDDAALSDRLERLAADPMLARRLATNGRALVRSRFDMRTMADAYERHYRSLLPRFAEVELCAS